jgi:hypothetical protein
MSQDKNPEGWGNNGQFKFNEVYNFGRFLMDFFKAKL